MDDKNQPITESDSLETPETPASQPSVVSGSEPANTGVVTPQQIAHKQDEPPKESRLKKLFSRLNLYFILLIVILLVLGAISFYAIMKNRKSAQDNALNTQKLTQEALDKLAGTDATVGDAKQTLSIESNAVFNGGVLVRGNIDVAGTLKVGGALSLPGLTVGGTTNLDQAALKSLTVSGDTAIQGKLTAQNGLNVTGGASFNGSVSVSTLNVDNLQLAKDLQLGHHITTTGSTPGHTNGGALGGGGTASNSGTDTAGTVTINTGNSAPVGCFITITFTTAFGGTPHIVISPSSSAAAGLNYYTNRSANNFSICTVSDPPDNTSGIIFDYVIVG
jgi:hypothetical protein